MSGKRIWQSRAAVVLALILSTSAAAAKECSQDIKPVTTDDPTVPVEELEYRIKPLSACELDAESDAWLALLRNKVEQISEVRIAALNSTVKDSPLEPTVQPAIGAETNGVETGAPSDDSQRVMKTSQLKRATALVAERTALVDRFEVVLLELKAKGGDSTVYEHYIKSVSGIEIDVTDVSATWTAITGWLRSPEGGLRWAMNIFMFVLLIIVFYVLSIIAGKAMRKAVATSFSTLLSDFLVMMAKRIVLFIGFFVGLSALEINVGPVLAIIGAAGFVIAFALQNSLSNFASGILMLLYRPFDIGDFVNVASVAGKVESMNLLSTQLRTPDNQLLVVPNNSVWGDVITNVTGITQRRVDLTFGIGYGDDIDKAQKILEDIVAGHDKVLAEPKSIVRLHQLADSSVNFVCRPWVTPENYWEVYWDITREVKRRFDEQGVSIPFPQRDVHIYHETPDAV